MERLTEPQDMQQNVAVKRFFHVDEYYWGYLFPQCVFVSVCVSVKVCCPVFHSFSGFHSLHEADEFVPIEYIY